MAGWLGYAKIPSGSYLTEMLVLICSASLCSETVPTENSVRPIGNAIPSTEPQSPVSGMSRSNHVLPRRTTSLSDYVSQELADRTSRSALGTALPDQRHLVRSLRLRLLCHSC
jgi:hypothetical protein